jgi:chromosome segregation ATPase
VNATFRIAVLAGLTIAASAPMQTLAQTARQGGSANPQALMQLQQLANERTALQAENSKLKGEVEKASKERDSLREAQESIARRSRGVEAELAKAVSDRARLEGDLAQERSRVQEVVTRLRETALTLKDIETQGELARRSLATREQELKVCVDRNQKLIALNTEVLNRFEDLGFWSAVAKREPFTRLKRVELENLADGYRDTARDNRAEIPKP